MVVPNVVVRSLYGYDRDALSVATGLKCVDKSLTLQSQAQDADINVIMKRFGVSGVLPQVAVPPSYGDFDSDVMDYGSALRLIQSADKSFAQLSAQVRAKFDNDPAAFLDFCENPANLEEMRFMGLAVPKPVVDAAVATEAKPKS